MADALHARGVPFMFSTGYSGQSVRYGYRDRPMLGKPYRNAQLAETFAELLRM